MPPTSIKLEMIICIATPSFQKVTIAAMDMKKFEGFIMMASNTAILWEVGHQICSIRQENNGRHATLTKLAMTVLFPTVPGSRTCALVDQVPNYLEAHYLMCSLRKQRNAKILSRFALIKRLNLETEL